MKYLVHNNDCGNVDIFDTLEKARKFVTDEIDHDELEYIIVYKVTEEYKAQEKGIDLVKVKPAKKRGRPKKS